MIHSTRHYLDFASATPLDDEVRLAMEPYWSMDYANPASIHDEGVRAAHALAHARVRLAECFGVQPRAVTFTGSVTEALTLGLIGTVRAWKRDHPEDIPQVIVSAIEHEAVLGAARSLEAEGVIVRYIPVNKEGVLRNDALVSSLTPATVVVAVMHGNNEIGTVQPIHDIARAIQIWKEKHKGITRDQRPTSEGAYPVLLVDAAQSLQTHRLDVGRLGADLLAVGSAKAYGPKGVGALLSRTMAPISPIIPGGSHESGRRAGTPSLPVLVGMVEAVTRAQSQTEATTQHYLALRHVLVGGLSQIPEVVIHGHPTDVLPHIVNFSVHGISHEYLALLLNTAGFAVATKSACHESDQDASHVLIALKDAGGAGDVEGIRVSLGRSTTVEQINLFLQVLPSQLDLAIASRDVTA